MKTIHSLTARALFSTYALDLLDPTKFKKCTIKDKGSVIQSLGETFKNLYLSHKNTSWLSLLDRYCLLVPLKVGYGSAVTLTASRLGVAVNGLLTVRSFINSYLAKPIDQRRELEKTRRYAFAFLTDLFCAVVGTYLTKAMIEHTVCALHFARVTSFMGKCYLKPIPSAFSFAFSMTVAIISAFAFFSMQKPDVAPFLFVESEYRVGMYLSLFLRKHLGVLSANNEPLSFSTKDKLNSLGEDCSNWTTLLNSVLDAEWELIKTVAKSNQSLSTGKKIKFKYPLDGNDIADQLEAQIPQNAGQQSTASPNDDRRISTVTRSRGLERTVDRLRALARAVKKLREMFEIVQKLTIEEGVLLGLWKRLMKEPSKIFIPPKDPSYIKEDVYRRLFFTFAEGTHGLDESKKGLNWGELNLIKAVHPDAPEIPKDASLVEKFENVVARNKYAYENGTDSMKSPLEIFGLTKETPHQDFSRIRKEYLLALHPDKHPDLVVGSHGYLKMQQLSQFAIKLFHEIEESRGELQKNE